MTLSTPATRVSVRARRCARRLGATLSLLALALPASAGQWHIAGVVRDSSGSPAALATVTLRTPTGHDYATQADGNGQYDLNVNDPSGSGTAIAWAELGGCSSPTSFVDQDMTKNFNLSCTP